MPNTADDSLAVSDQGDPIVALVAEHSRIEAEWNAFPEEPEEAYDAAAKRFDAQQRRIEDQVARRVATSAAGITAQVDLLVFIVERDHTTSTWRLRPLKTERPNRFKASIAAGVERLALPKAR